MAKVILLSVPALVCAIAIPCHAADDEIQVYLDDKEDPGKLSVDLHNNYVFSGRRTPNYAGEQPPGGVYRLTAEFNYGLTDTLELGAYVLTTRSADGDLHGDGGKLRIKYIAPHDPEVGAFWGLNLEVGRSSLRVSEQAWNTQLKGILGFRDGAWLVAINTNIDWSPSSGGGPATLDLDAKLAYSIAPKTQIGFESYNQWGPLKHLQSWSNNSKALFAVIDHEFDHFALNAGIGRGLTDDADRWVLKFIVGIPF